MNIPEIATWPSTIQEAKVLQETLSCRVVRRDHFQAIHTVAGIDVGFENGNTTTRAAVVVLQFPSLVVLEQAIARRPTSFPYVPGFLSFRELPSVLDALQQLTVTPDLLLCDGQGIAHPRRFGIAAHLGVLTDVPSIGVAKSILVGTHDDVPQERGAWRPLWHREECVGAAVRTRTKTRPLYVSIGHRISLETAIDYVMRCTTKYRLPETTRHADKLASGRR